MLNVEGFFLNWILGERFPTVFIIPASTISENGTVTTFPGKVIPDTKFSNLTRLYLVSKALGDTLQVKTGESCPWTPFEGTLARTLSHNPVYLSYL